MKTKEQQNESKNGILRMAIVSLSVIIQALIIIGLFTWFSLYARWIEISFSILAVFFVIIIYSRDSISAIKMPWIMLIMVFPVIGIV
ncbi:MAG: PLDc N-terminal domain-containing protein, partial [Clostridia bacterium]|nr:PLDc N-terminal domain-containing protein [Clostridia bacterium]